MIWQTVSTSSEDTEKLGELLGRALKPPAVIELRSDLGGGKTTFVKGLAAGFESKDRVASPTFTLNKIYLKDKAQAIHHFDFYRLTEPGILADQLAESLGDRNVISVVEWGGIIEDVLPKERISIELQATANSEDERKISVNYPLAMLGLMDKLQSQWERSRP